MMYIQSELGRPYLYDEASKMPTRLASGCLLGQLEEELSLRGVLSILDHVPLRKLS
jgi:hypothetical protein